MVRSNATESSSPAGRRQRGVGLGHGHTYRILYPKPLDFTMPVKAISLAYESLDSFGRAVRLGSQPIGAESQAVAGTQDSRHPLPCVPAGMPKAPQVRLLTDFHLLLALHSFRSDSLEAPTRAAQRLHRVAPSPSRYVDPPQLQRR
jgi:hypothetical protein